MLSTMTISPELAEAITNVLIELASELDLHYEDDDFFALAPTIARMKQLQDMLEKEGYQPPEAYVHVLRRYNRHRQ